MPYLDVYKRLSAPLIFLAIVFNITPKFSEVKASNKIIPANDKDLDLYRSMGITYLCSASWNGNDADFEKSLAVATNLFSTVIEQKHGGFVKEGKNKQQKVEKRTLLKNISLQLVGGALGYCPKNVPEKREKEFKNFVKKIEESKKK